MTEHKKDLVTEKEFAVIQGTTKKALEVRRSRGQIPREVWTMLFGKVHYSIKRYDEWLESLWSGRQVSSPSEKPSASASCGKASAAAKPSPTRKPRKGSRPQPVLELR